MNLFYKNYIPKIAIAILLFSGAQLFQSCSKDKAEDITPGGETRFDGKITVQVLGIEDDETITLANPKGDAGGRTAGGANNPVPGKVVSFAGFDAVTSVERDVLKQSNVSISHQSGTSSNSNIQLAAAMAKDVAYRLFLYKKDGTFVSSTLLTSGTAGAVDAEKGTSYDWYALSYNTSEGVPDVANPLSPSLVLPGGKDILYASGEIIIPAGSTDGNKPLGITFKHKFARIGVELNTMGMFANMTNANVTVSGLTVKTGTINLKTGALTGLTTFAQTIDYTGFKNIDSLYADAKVAYVYTADTIPVSALTITVKGLDITLDNGTTRSFNTLLTATPSVFTFAVTPVLGRSYRAQINLLESPLTLGGVKWARTDVYFNGGHNPYRFAHTYAPKNNLNSYFSFNSKTPGAYGVDGTTGDPCAEVYPAGIWRTASNANYTAIAGTLAGIGGLPFTYATNATIGYFEYTAVAGTGAPYPGNKLRFSFNGEGTNISLVAGLIEVGLGDTFGEEAHVWSRDAVLAIPPLLSVGAYYYNGTHTPIPIFGGFTDAARVPTGLLNIGLLGLNVIESNFKNVRCVRS